MKEKIVLGGDYMIPVDRDKILSHFAGFAAVLLTLVNYILRLHVKIFITLRRNFFFVLPGFRFAGTKFSHIIPSVRLSGMKKLINRSVRENP